MGLKTRDSGSVMQDFLDDIKPLGLPAPALADICYRFASGGIDIIKDDHSLSDQPVAPFSEPARGEP